ncbi:MAG: DNA polymerase IV [Caldilineaceae bacterium]|nr:DNA polymerase IV [Caldilineaceae bacterium]
MGAFRKIIHLDLDAFFCAVEELRDPSLRGRPFAVGGRPESRGVVASCSYPARRFGVHSAMPMGQALRLCPTLLIVPARHGEYGAVSRQVMARLHALTPLVEQLSIDEAFLDVTERPELASVLARQLQQTIRTELGLPCSLGVATNKLVAKIANNVGKAAAKGDEPPNAIQVVPPGREAEFLAPLPAHALWGVGPKTAERLAALGIETIGDIARWPEAELVRLFGKNGYDLARHARGLDDRPVDTQRERKSVSQETTYARDVTDGDVLRRTLHEQSSDVARMLRHKELAGTTVKLKLRWPDFTTITRQTTLEHATDAAEEIYATVLQLFDREWQGRPVRLIGVGVSGLSEAVRQPSLWDQPDERQERLYDAVKKLRSRFGDAAIRRASELDELDEEDS